MSTIKQVANMAGVSTATVSKYLNGVTLKEVNKIAVENAIKALDFKVNSIARGLRTNKSMTIGILIHKLDNIFATSIVSVIENILLEHGYGTIICDYNSNAELETMKLNFLKDKMVDGIIAIPYKLKKEDIANIDIPIVFVDRIVKDADCDCILIDNAKATSDIVEYLIENGHRNIGILCEPESVYTSVERLNGYLTALLINNIKPNKKYIMKGEYDITSVYNMVRELLNMPNPPTAIFATNYEITMYAIIALGEMGIKVPDQISFVGFDNIEISNAVRPKLSVVVQPIREIAETAARTLLSKLGGEKCGTKITKLNAQLIKQDSVKRI